MPLFILDFQFGLLLHQFFKQIPLGFGDERLAEITLVFFEAEPLVVRQFWLAVYFSVLVNKRLVKARHSSLIVVPVIFFFCKVDLFLLAIINLVLRGFVQPLEQLFILQVAAFFPC